jgi:pimeloyl-ACP methyl ester carboxylesterase
MNSPIVFLLLLAPAWLAGCSTDRFWESACGFLPRPQNPVKRAYVVREATISGGAEGIQLAGELTMPQGAGPFPGIVLLSGTGPQDRNEKILGHKPFLVLSDYLTRHGYAVFRYDDRGYGKSTGNHITAVYEDFAADASAALAWLKSLNEIDAEHSGYIGHSQGGSVAVIASFMEPAGFVVSLAGGVQTLAEVVLQQTLDQARVLHKSSEYELKETRQN